MTVQYVALLQPDNTYTKDFLLKKRFFLGTLANRLKKKVTKIFLKTTTVLVGHVNIAPSHV